MLRGTLQKKLRQRKLNKSTILPVLSDPHVNKIGTKTCQGLWM